MTFAPVELHFSTETERRLLRTEEVDDDNTTSTTIEAQRDNCVIQDLKADYICCLSSSLPIMSKPLRPFRMDLLGLGLVTSSQHCRAVVLAAANQAREPVACTEQLVAP